MFLNSWHFFVTHRRMVGKTGSNYCSLDQVFGNNAVINIHVAVKRTRIILHRVL